MARKAREARKERIPAARYGIAEWFGKDIGLLTPEERQTFGRLAARQDQENSLTGAPVCPFLSTLIPGARCNKASGVCSVRKYAAEGSIVAGDKVVTMCPSRFIQSVEPGKTLFSWIAEKMLDTAKVTVVKETPFLRKIADVQRPTDIAEDMAAEAKEEEKQAGRIDWILVNPETVSAGELEWCAVETQALYFSGARMRLEFDAYAHAPSDLLFPTGKRRPDYRSSGPKRLWPQLDVKVPVLRSWGKKIVVVVDRFFYSNMNRLADPSPRARSDKERRENADVAWFIVDYDEHLHLTAGEVVFTSLDGSRIALNATEPLSKADFTQSLKNVIADESRTKKVFKVSE
ncbi:MAG: NotI family restriction endonuclease [Terriglobia bacterium]|nr:NotI family restriction endonuclease [Terriglobia bacterium]